MTQINIKKGKENNFVKEWFEFWIGFLDSIQIYVYLSLLQNIYI